MTEIAPLPTTLLIERTIAAPIERVFAAWLDPQRLAQWLSPTSRASAETNPTVGGTFRVVMLGDPDESAAAGLPSEIEHTGEYLEIDPHRRLGFTWVSPYTGPEPSVVTIDLEPAGGSTRLRLRHDRLPASAVHSHAGGWGSILDKLARLVEEG